MHSGAAVNEYDWNVPSCFALQPLSVPVQMSGGVVWLRGIRGWGVSTLLPCSSAARRGSGALGTLGLVQALDGAFLANCARSENHSARRKTDHCGAQRAGCTRCIRYAFEGDFLYRQKLHDANPKAAFGFFFQPLAPIPCLRP